MGLYNGGAERRGREGAYVWATFRIKYSSAFLQFLYRYFLYIVIISILAAIWYFFAKVL